MVFSLENEASFQDVYKNFSELSTHGNTADLPLIVVGTQGMLMMFLIVLKLSGLNLHEIEIISNAYTIPVLITHVLHKPQQFREPLIHSSPKNRASHGLVVKVLD